MSLQLLDDWVLLKKVAPNEFTASGLFLPSTNDSLQGEVVAVGPRAGDVAIGEKVSYEFNAGTDLVIDDKKHITLRSKHLIAAYEG